MRARLFPAGGGPPATAIPLPYPHLLAELSQPEHTNPDALILPRAGLAHCFTQLVEAADQIAATTIFRPG
jgi:hypothetical protein